MKIKCILAISIASSICFFGCSKEAYSLKSKNGTINIVSMNEVQVIYEDKIDTYKNVQKLIWYAGAPYFELADGRILRWHQEVSKNAFGLEQVGNTLYFLQQIGDSPEWEGTAIGSIKPNGSVNYTNIRQNGGGLITEYLGVFGKRFFVENLQKGFCVADATGRVLSCYTWPNEK